MDPPDKKLTQPANSDSDAAPPSKRHQPSSAAAGADQQPAASSAHPTAVTAAAADPSTAPAVAAPPVSAGSAALAATHRLSPAERCPSDPLSVALSFLGLRDFAVASRVCRHWQRAAALQSAWPEFSVERLISGLIEDEDHWIQSRSVRVNAKHLQAGALERVAQSAQWGRLAELHIRRLAELYDSSDQVPLNHVALLSRLRSLYLRNVFPADVAAVFGSLAPRLVALHFYCFQSEAIIQPHLHLLTDLRALALDGTLVAQWLLALHQLEYLQLHDFEPPSHDLLLAIRRLSVQHRLRHLSLTSFSYPALDLEPLVSELSGADSVLAPAALVSIRLNCYLSDAGRSALLSLPNLTRLDWRGVAATGELIDPQSPLPPSPLQQLHLDFEQYGGGAAQLVQQAAVRASQLRELRVARLPPSFDQLIRPLHSLRLLEIALSESSPLSPELAQSLAALPLFTELVVRLSMQPFKLATETLRRIAESPSFRLVRLLSRSDRPQLALPRDVDAQLAERLADFRVQAEWRGRTTSHRLIIGADGTVTWPQTEM